MMFHAINAFAEMQAWVTEIHVSVTRMMITSTVLLLLRHLRSLSLDVSLSLSLLSENILCVAMSVFASFSLSS